MPLSNGYGVLKGALVSHSIDPPDAEGKWPHYRLMVAANGITYECVINLKSRSEIKIEYLAFMNARTDQFASIVSLPDGWHPLAAAAGSGALDVIRHEGLQNPYMLCKQLRRPFRIIKKVRCDCTRWWKENGLNAVKLMQHFLENVSRVYCFGEPYETGHGVHNIHMNQGDPIESQFSAENAVWQDGGVIYQYTTPQPRLTVLVTKFETQSLVTDAQGHPIPT